ncbi:cell division protein FtsW [Lactobacillus delbrueckii subsp. bulgaricus]|uniref:Probable peptidoglycan glycosyltransferase FtsW n=1 Tax=Lactobacillus delbrueckii subsp. bulgaricus (strain ATCC 11842 / DSM 20081 / BCRC 10696 / JCM 1002 / NBRC 13953 / NCIMB 11778 / NCTC 12712 / WDCM 00102 / Lb 14) TaxID=390333 RepID=Q1GAR2_LACDA|nr:FtsW/RodA/SpoVE family cell cycle protein [Lactobacillus delbrueckii]KRN38975.1 cell division protein FtsW [Lactobacillus delbrueckii subsp. bulgaricus ATCC 11842 = JCM 1002]MDG9748060.1 FtsW/RodA/SpoVE family cell cycle protein [Lactobacillus delbrueckii subsp. bulgaricus ATCC 11842 = JCM 1002]GEB90561.1 cell division protein FtsW [Lactobacillus delbrueckii subsp. bulgaricus]CAI97591.1 Cell division protein FtsW [Lactobacillus delbrueckii subsp. bulgaricus ATCC 11842 = JCM 1002]
MKKNKVAATAAKIKETFQYFDYRIFIVYLLLMTIGVIAVYSASSEILLINGFKATVYGQKQLLYAFFGVLICLACYSINLDYLRRGKLLLWLLVIVAGLLVYVLFFGQAVNGAKGWINLGPINIQPLELAKLVLTLYLARMLAKADGRLVRGHIISQLLPTAIIAGLLMILVLIEPDFGGTAIIFCLVLIMYSVSGIPTGYILLSIIGITVLVVGGFSLIVAWNPSFLQDIYVYKRFIAFLHPFKTAANEGAQLVNSYYAIHNGGLFGLGLGNSIQKRGYLPEPYTDFILSIIAEEVGSLGALVVLGLLFYLVILIMERGVKAQSQYSTLICFGVTAIIFFQTLFNVGAVLGLMPITGVTLPFISYGGSSLWVLSAAIGLVLNVTAEEKIRQEVQAEDEY